MPSHRTLDVDARQASGPHITWDWFSQRLASRRYDPPLSLSKNQKDVDTMASVKAFPTIKSIRSFVIGGVGSGMWNPQTVETKRLANQIAGGDYHNVKGGHW